MHYAADYLRRLFFSVFISRFCRSSLFTDLKLLDWPKIGRLQSLMSLPAISRFALNSFGCLNKYMIALPIPLDLSWSVCGWGSCIEIKHTPYQWYTRGIVVPKKVSFFEFQPKLQHMCRKICFQTLLTMYSRTHCMHKIPGGPIPQEEWWTTEQMCVWNQ